MLIITRSRLINRFLRVGLRKKKERNNSSSWKQFMTLFDTYILCFHQAIVLIIYVMFVIAVRRWRAARGLPRGWRWRRWRRVIRPTRKCPWRSRSSSQSTPRGNGSSSSPVPTAPASTASTRSCGGSCGRGLRGTGCSQARQRRHIRVSEIFLVSFSLSFVPVV